MLRSPEETITSIVSLFKKKGYAHRYSDPYEACQYYVERLRALSAMAEAVARDNEFLYVDAGAVLNQTERLLQETQVHLGLSQPLKQEYETFKFTGKSGAGDTSEDIHARFVSNRRRSYGNLDVPRMAFNEATSVYKAVRKDLIRRSKRAVVESIT